VGVLALIIGTSTFLFTRKHTNDTSKPDATTISALPHRSNTAMQPHRLASGLVPPTNRWFSGIAFPAAPQPVYPLPLSFLPSGQGFTFGLPTVKTTANTVFGSYNPALALSFGSDSYYISRYDAVSVTLTYTKAGKAVATVTVAEGSPFVSVVLLSDDPLILPAGFARQADNTYAATAGGTVYGMYTTAEIAGNTLRNAPGTSLVFYPVAQGSSVQAMAAYAKRPLTDVSVAYGATAAQSTTTLSYHTKTHASTLYAALPEQNITGARKLPGTYATIYGTLSLYVGNDIQFGVPISAASDTLAVDRLSAAQKQTLVDQLRGDTATTNLTKTDSYYGGKELYRAANLYQLALQLGQKDLAATLKAQLVTDLDQWLDPHGSRKRDNRYFYYDTTVKGLVAVTPSYGSEAFNDHHFHYGYFLYAAAVVAQHDTGFASRNRAMLNLIASDIGAPSASAYFPKQRVFDPYFGHSWASGNGDFADGNNQESSSEAINAWNGLALWAQASGQTKLQRSASWMLSRETAAAAAEWTDIATSKPPFTAGYAHSMVSMNWGGKRDYATFFSAANNAIVGIQLIPLNPSMVALGAQKDRIRQIIAAAIPGGDFNVQFGDYLLMYQSLLDKQTALRAATGLDVQYIDDADSRAYMLAWIMTR